jgi:hypothetical protein
MPIRPLRAARRPSAALLAAALSLWTGGAAADPLVIEADGVVRIGPPASGAAALDVAGTITATGLTAKGPITASGLTTTGPISATGLTATGPITATGLTATGPITATGLTATGPITATGLTATGPISATGLTATGPILATGLTATGTLTGQSLGISLVPRSNPDKHPQNPGAMFYVTGELYEGAPPDGAGTSRIEFRHSNGTQGVGIGYNTLYATGSNADQPLKLAARGESSVMIAGNGNLDVPGKLTIGDLWNISSNGATLLFRYGEKTIMAIHEQERLQYNVPGIGVYYLGRQSDITGANNAMWQSDLRLKQEIARIPGAMDKVRGISGVRFRWNADAVARFEAELGPDDARREAFEAEARRPTIGVIAQEVEAALPEAVKVGADGYRSVNYRDLIPLLIEAAKEQDAIVAAQAARLAALEARLAALSAQVEALTAAAPTPTSY